MGTIRVTFTGTVADLHATGEARMQGAKLPLVQVRRSWCGTESAPAGAPAVPAPGTLMQGFSSQLAGGFRCRSGCG